MSSIEKRSIAMKRFGGKWLTLACLGILFSFLSLLFVASVGVALTEEKYRLIGESSPIPAASCPAVT